MPLRIAIKELAYFICQSGNLTPEFFSNRDLQQGTKAHQYLQAKYNSESTAEVFIKKEINYQGKDLLLNGFIDGVLVIDDEIIIEEIKSTMREIEEMHEKDHLEHQAQLKIYGYLYALEHDLDKIHLRLTYISTIDYQTRSFDNIVSKEELEVFVFDLLEEYMTWIGHLETAASKKIETIQTIKFPFQEMRPGQRDMMKACFQAMKKNEILYTIAPTGIGKTMATLFSSLKTLQKNDKLFYLTAKGSGKSAPLKAIQQLATQGLKVKTINLTAKKKICNISSKNCNPDECPYAIGYFDRLKNATLDIFPHYDIYDENKILEVSNKHKICAFEFSLYLSYFCDIVIADYNYVFDPKAHLIRYFEDDTYQPKVLVDEAHNLISRSKDMYSASISEEDIRNLRKKLNGFKPSVRNECNKVIEKVNSYKEFLADKALYASMTLDSDLVVLIKNLLTKCDALFEENKKLPHKDEILDVYFKMLDFNRTAEYFGPTHRFLAKIKEDVCSIDLLCLDASSFLLDTIHSSIKGIVFFSATLTPFDYHAHLLTQGEGKFIELPSPFNPANLDIIINNSISTKYRDRDASIDYIIEAIEALTSAKSGNYIVFFPSYQYLKMIVDAIESPQYEVLVQKSNSTEPERNEILERFKDTTQCKVGFFVLGGIYAEGIDFVGDWLSGVIIVGVGLPLYCDENNILKDYFEELYHNGFDYAYTYPGFTKVIQAAGRVIRSDEDRGVVLLIDERFTYGKYQALMPRHWLNKKVINDTYYLQKEIKKFFET